MLCPSVSSHRIWWRVTACSHDYQSWLLCPSVSSHCIWWRVTACRHDYQSDLTVYWIIFINLFYYWTQITYYLMLVVVLKTHLPFYKILMFSFCHGKIIFEIHDIEVSERPWNQCGCYNTFTTCIDSVCLVVLMKAVPIIAHCASVNIHVFAVER